MKSDEELVLDHGCDIDACGHAWGMGWEDSDKPHPGFGTYGSYVDQCYKCGMYSHEMSGQPCGPVIRKMKEIT